MDTAEQLPYRFEGLRSDAVSGRRPIQVQTKRHGLERLGGGDYSIEGLQQRVAVERKSKEDLYGSVAKRPNFETRLHKMSSLVNAIVVVEAEFFDVIKNPPPFSQLNPVALSRTITAWIQRFHRVHWMFLPGRTAAEGFTYRYLERAWLDWQPGTEMGELEPETGEDTNQKEAG